MTGRTRTHEAKRSEAKDTGVISLLLLPVRLCVTHTQRHTYTHKANTKWGWEEIWAMKPAPCYIDKKKQERRTPTPCDACRLKRNTDQKKSRFDGLSFFEVLPSSTSAAADNRPSPFPGVPESFIVPPVQPRGPHSPSRPGLALRQHLKDAHARHLLLHPAEDEFARRRGGLLEHLLHRDLGGRPGRRRAHGREGREPC